MEFLGQKRSISRLCCRTAVPVCFPICTMWDQPPLILTFDLKVNIFLLKKIFFNLFFKNLFYFWLCWVFVAAHGLSLVAASEGYSSLRCAGFSLQWLLLLQSTRSRRAGFSSCGTRAQ